MIDEYGELTAKDVVGNGLGLIYNMIPGLFLETLSKTSKNLNKDK